MHHAHPVVQRHVAVVLIAGHLTGEVDPRVLPARGVVGIGLIGCTGNRRIEAEPAPLTGQLLGDLGAEVVKIEQRGEGDYFRRYGLIAVKDAIPIRSKT